MSLRARIWLLLLVAVLLVLGSGVALRTSYETAQRASNRVSQTLQPAAESIAGLDKAIASLNAGSTAYALTGNTDDLAVYIEGSARATNELRRLSSLLEFDQTLSQRLDQTATALREWRHLGLRPIVEATRDGDTRRAQDLIIEGPSTELYAQVRTYQQALDELILGETGQALEQERAAFERLWRILNFVLVVLLLLVGLFAWLLLRGVLRPLGFLADQLVEAAQTDHHETPIKPAGPPEIREVGQDAESLRRELVAEIDRARQAHQGLEQRGPLLAALREELENTHLEPIAGLDVYGQLKPAEGVMAGDWWSAQRIGDGRLALAITDVAGHGPQAAVEALRLKNVMELSLAQHGDPARALRLGAEGMSASDRLATCAIVVIDTVTGDLTWANAGHPAPLVMRNGEPTTLPPSGPLLSVLGGDWANHHEHLEPGDVLMLMTDGLSESHDESGAELGEDGVVALITRAISTEPDSEGIVGQVLSVARARSVDWHRDDVTCIAVRRLPLT